LLAMRMSGITSKGVCILLSCFLLAVSALPAFSQRRKAHLDLNQVLSHMDQAAKRLKTLSADLEYTKVTVLVNDFSTESGELYFRNSKTPDILIKFTEPAPKTILFRKNKAEIYQPKINQLQEFDLSKHSQLIQQFLLLGFGTESNDMQKAYAVRYLREEALGGDTTALLELTPREGTVASQLAKVQLWISEESWLPVQQKFFEAGGDYSVARYHSVKVNRDLPSSVFQLRVANDVKRVRR
jgi:outer membrane lipoprotein-sorting protein